MTLAIWLINAWIASAVVSASQPAGSWDCYLTGTLPVPPGPNPTSFVVPYLLSSNDPAMTIEKCGSMAAAWSFPIMGLQTWNNGTGVTMSFYACEMSITWSHPCSMLWGLQLSPRHERRSCTDLQHLMPRQHNADLWYVQGVMT